MMINQRLDFVGKKTSPVFIDLTLPDKRSRRLKFKKDLLELPKDSKDVYMESCLEKYLKRLTYMSEDEKNNVEL